MTEQTQGTGGLLPDPKGRTIIFLEGGMKNIEKNCSQGLKR